MDATKLANELIELHRSPRLVPPFSARYPGLTPDAGYAAARQLHAHRLAQGWKLVGRKNGFTNRGIWARYGVDGPMWGAVYDRTLIFAHDNQATVPLAGLVQPRIEPEICFGLKAPPPRSHDPHAILAAIEWVAHSVEIVQAFHPGWKFSLPDCTAANGLHGRLVLGPKVPVARLKGLESRLATVEVALRKGKKTVERGLGANVLDSPLFALAHLVEVLAIQPEFAQLHAGELVSTGTLTDAHPVAPGETWSTAFDGLPLPGLEIRFT